MRRRMFPGAQIYARCLPPADGQEKGLKGRGDWVKMKKYSFYSTEIIY